MFTVENGSQTSVAHPESSLTKRAENITPLLKSPHLLPVCQRIDLKIRKNTLNFTCKNTFRSLRSSGRGLFRVPRVTNNVKQLLVTMILFTQAFQRIYFSCILIKILSCIPFLLFYLFCFNCEAL